MGRDETSPPHIAQGLVVATRHSGSVGAMRTHSDGGPVIPRHDGNFPGADWARRLFQTYDVKDVLDVGANVGGWLATWFASGARRAHAIEPVPEVFEVLHQAYKDDDRVTLHRRGVSDRPAQIKDQNIYNCWSLLPQGSTKLDAALEFKDKPPFDVDLVTIDDLLSETGFAPDFIKIDVDGYDVRALRGGRSYVSRRLPVMMIEVSGLPKMLGDDCESMIRDLYDMDYVLTNINEGQRYDSAADFMKIFPWHTSWDAICEPRSA